MTMKTKTEPIVKPPKPPAPRTPKKHILPIIGAVAAFIFIFLLVIAFMLVKNLKRRKRKRHHSYPVDKEDDQIDANLNHKSLAVKYNGHGYPRSRLISGASSTAPLLHSSSLRSESIISSNSRLKGQMLPLAQDAKGIVCAFILLV